jgi:hypothetical protein
MQVEVEFESVLNNGLTVFVVAAGLFIAADNAWAEHGYSSEPAHVEQIHLDAYHRDRAVAPEALMPHWEQLEREAAALMFAHVEQAAA